MWPDRPVASFPDARDDGARRGRARAARRPSEDGGGDDGDPDAAVVALAVDASSSSAWPCCSSVERPGYALFGGPRRRPRTGFGRRGLPAGHALAPRPGRADVAVHADKDIATQDPTVRSIAGDILRTQQFETGVMAGQLRTWGAAEANESGTGMAWMGMPVPIDRMQGMASADELERLKAATGKDADLLFLQLMGVHHEGGLHMALDALARAETDEARTLAESIVQSQQFELDELRAPRSPAHRPLTPGALPAHVDASTARIVPAASGRRVADRASAPPECTPTTAAGVVHHLLLGAQVQHQPAEQRQLGLAAARRRPVLASRVGLAWPEPPRRSCAGRLARRQSVRAIEARPIAVRLPARRRRRSTASTAPDAGRPARAQRRPRRSVERAMARCRHGACLDAASTRRCRRNVLDVSRTRHASSTADRRAHAE